MIKVNKPINPPQILIDKKEEWTNELLSALEEFKSFSKLPAKFSNRYRHTQIKECLLDCSHNKCAYCESFSLSVSPIQVEHFKPKSIYHELTYEWNNLLPSCPLCNSGKRDLDTGLIPIVNPCEDEPEQFFDYNYIRIIPKITETEDIRLIAERTIKTFDLNRRPLYSRRSELIQSLIEYEDDLRENLEEVRTSTGRKLNNLVNKIRSSYIDIEDLSQNHKKYAGLVRFFIQESDIIQEAISII